MDNTTIAPSKPLPYIPLYRLNYKHKSLIMMRLLSCKNFFRALLFLTAAAVVVVTVVASNENIFGFDLQVCHDTITCDAHTFCVWNDDTDSMNTTLTPNRQCATPNSTSECQRVVCNATRRDSWLSTLQSATTIIFASECFSSQCNNTVDSNNNDAAIPIRENDDFFGKAASLETLTNVVVLDSNNENRTQSFLRAIGVTSLVIGSLLLLAAAYLQRLQNKQTSRLQDTEYLVQRPDGLLI
jgi:hypothetical protein